MPESLVSNRYGASKLKNTIVLQAILCKLALFLLAIFHVLRHASHSCSTCNTLSVLHDTEDGLQQLSMFTLTSGATPLTIILRSSPETWSCRLQQIKTGMERRRDGERVREIERVRPHLRLAG